MFAFIVWVLSWKLEQLGGYFSIEGACCEETEDPHDKEAYETFIEASYFWDEIEEAENLPLNRFLVGIQLNSDVLIIVIRSPRIRLLSWPFKFKCLRWILRQIVEINKFVLQFYLWDIDLEACP